MIAKAAISEHWRSSGYAATLAEKRDIATLL